MSGILEQLTLSDQVAAYLRDTIRSQDLKAGDVVPSEMAIMCKQRWGGATPI